jgi:hypothetical protein
MELEDELVTTEGVMIDRDEVVAQEVEGLTDEVAQYFKTRGQ